MQTPSQLSREHAHAMKNIFSIIRANVEMIEEENHPDDVVQRRLLRIIASCERGEEIVEQIQAKKKEKSQGLFVGQKPDYVNDVGVLQGRILVVDDEPDVLKVIEHYLKDHELAISTLTSAGAAIEHLQRDGSRYDLVLTDLEMPYCNGVELCSFLQSHKPELPVIVMTGYGQSLDEVDLGTTPIRAVVAKPLDRKLLLATLGQFLAAS
nr:response regulator [uncultured Desulfobulbus sp.]